jgi:hypothetical protein
MAALSLKAGGPIIEQHGIGHKLLGKGNWLLLSRTQGGRKFGERALGRADFQPRRSSSPPSANQWRGSLSIKLARNRWRDQAAATEGGQNVRVFVVTEKVSATEENSRCAAMPTPVNATT